MNQQVYLTNMFPDYAPPEELTNALSQAAIVAAYIFPETGTVERGTRYTDNGFWDTYRTVYSMLPLIADWEEAAKLSTVLVM